MKKKKQKTISILIKDIIKKYSSFRIGCGTIGYNACVIKVPEKKCKCCGAIIKFSEDIHGLGKTPKEAINNLYKELKKFKDV